MFEPLTYTTFPTEMGWVGVLASENGLRKTTLPQATAYEAHLLLGDESDDAFWFPDALAEITEQLQRYYAGEPVTFTESLDINQATEFQLRVWEATRQIPYGETRSYQQIAQNIGQPQAARAVGQALKENPLPVIIPCHRVIGQDGDSGGFSGGLETKLALLKLEQG